MKKGVKLAGKEASFVSSSKFVVFVLLLITAATITYTAVDAALVSHTPAEIQPQGAGSGLDTDFLQGLSSADILSAEGGLSSGNLIVDNSNPGQKLIAPKVAPDYPGILISPEKPNFIEAAAVSGSDYKVAYMSREIYVMQCLTTDCGSRTNPVSVTTPATMPDPRYGFALGTASSTDFKIAYVFENNPSADAGEPGEEAGIYVIRCTSADCSSHNNPVKVFSMPTNNGYNKVTDISMAVVSSNDYKIVFSTVTGNYGYDVRVIQCTSADCSSRTSPVQIAAPRGAASWKTAVSATSSTNYKIAYLGYTAYLDDSTGDYFVYGTELFFVNCNSADCSSRTSPVSLNAFPYQGTSASKPSITPFSPTAIVGSIKQPNANNFGKHFIAKCDSSGCSSPIRSWFAESVPFNYPTPVTFESIKQSAIFSVSSTDWKLALTTYFTEDTSTPGKYLAIYKCMNSDCTFNTRKLIDTVESPAVSIAGLSSNEFTIFYTASDGLKAVRCVTPDCSTLSTTGYVDIGTPQRPFNKVYAGSYFAKTATIQGFDLAEDYPIADNTLEKGDVVRISASSESGTGYAVEKTKASYDQKTIGVISTEPGIRLGDWLSGRRTKPVALIGRVPVKVSAENGQIEVGDYLTSSSLPGVAMKATRQGRAIGMALENYDQTGTGMIQAYINPQLHGGLG